MSWAAACTSEQERVAGFFQDLADARCTYLATCCSSHELGSLLSGATSDPASCNQYFTGLTTVDDYLLQLAASEEAIEVDTSATEECLSAIKDARCSRAPLEAISPVECKLSTLFDGQRQQGEACHSEYECDEDSRCALASASNYSKSPQGVCVPLRQEGEHCYSSSQYGTSMCAPGLVCTASAKGKARACHAHARLGESCDNIPCDDDPKLALFCGTSSGATGGYCLKKKSIGDSCQYAKQCISGACGSAGSYGGICKKKEYSGLCSETSSGSGSSDGGLLADSYSPNGKDVYLPYADGTVPSADTGAAGSCGLALYVNGKKSSTCNGGFSTCLNFFNGFTACLCNVLSDYSTCKSKIAGGYSESSCKSGYYTRGELIQKMSNYIKNTWYSNVELHTVGDCTGYPK